MVLVLFVYRHLPKQEINDNVLWTICIVHHVTPLELCKIVRLCDARTKWWGSKPVSIWNVMRCFMLWKYGNIRGRYINSPKVYTLSKKGGSVCFTGLFIAKKIDVSSIWWPKKFSSTVLVYIAHLRTGSDIDKKYYSVQKFKWIG